MIRVRSGTALNHSQDSENFFLKLGDSFRPFQRYARHNWGSRNAKAKPSHLS